MQNQLTEAEAWRMIGEAFEAKAAHPELDDIIDDMDSDLAGWGLCHGIETLVGRDDLDRDLADRMSEDKVQPEVQASGGSSFIQPYVNFPEGVEIRATLAYLFAEEAAA